MTTVAVLVDPPRSRLLPQLADSSSLSESAVRDCYTALARDTVSAVARSGGELLVNYRPYEGLGVDGDDAEADVREMLGDAVPSDARFEKQVGETYAGRAGNTATYLLETEEVSSVGIVDPRAALLARAQIDGAAMKLRSCDVVVGPGTEGRVYYAAFGEPINFEDAYAAPAVRTLTDRALDAGLDVDFLELLPVVETERDLAATVALVRSRRRADRLVPPHLSAWIDESGVDARAGDEGLELV